MEHLGNLNKGFTMRNTLGLPFDAPYICTVMQEVCNHTYQSLFSYQSTPQWRTAPGGGPSCAYLPYLPLESKAREKGDESQAMQVFMHTCVYSNHPISPLIILQSSNLSLYSMFVCYTARSG